MHFDVFGSIMENWYNFFFTCLDSLNSPENTSGPGAFYFGKLFITVLISLIDIGRSSSNYSSGFLTLTLVVPTEVSALINCDSLYLPFSPVLKALVCLMTSHLLWI